MPVRSHAYALLCLLLALPAPLLAQDVDGDTYDLGVDCDDNDASNFPGNPEVCDGQDNDCSGSADFGTTETPTSSTFTRSGGGGITNTDFTKGNMLTATDSVMVTGFGVVLDTTGNVTLTIAEGSSTTGSFTILSTTDLGTVSTGKQTHSVTGLNVPINAGNVYWFGATWTGSATNYYGGSGAPVWGNFSGGAWTSSGTAPTDGWTADMSLSGSSAYDMDITSQTVPTATEVDSDADSYLSCLDCDDTDGTSFPGATELCDGADNDCDGVVFSQYESPLGTSSSSGTTYFRGGQYSITTTISLNGFAVEINPSAGATLEFLVYEDTGSGMVQIASQTSTAAGGQDYYYSPTFDGLALTAGNDYTLGVYWSGTANYYWKGLSSLPQDTGWGSHDTGQAATTASTPTPSDLGLGQAYHMIVVPFEAETDNDSDTYLACDDCDDLDAGTNPGATEACDGIDSDCDGSIAGELDGDNDGYLACDDCDDTDGTSNAGASEVCDGLDNDCDGTVPADEADADVDLELVCDGDCDDTNAAVNTSATEACDGVDTDCDGTVLSQYESPLGTSSSSGATFLRGGLYSVTTTISLNGFAVEINPSAGATLEFLVYEDTGSGMAQIASRTSTAAGGQDYYYSPTFDGLALTAGNDYTLGVYWSGTADYYWIGRSNLPVDTGWGSHDDGQAAGTATTPTPSDLTAGQAYHMIVVPFEAETDNDSDTYFACDDCDDLDVAINPAATEVCDGVDNDCDGVMGSDETDDDADGYDECIDGDCDDTDATVYLGATELCDGLDNDCDNVVPSDEGDGDNDGDLTCADCDDADVANFNGNTEVCDGQDNDCNSAADFDAAGEVDADNDSSLSCADCDDSDSANTPGGTELCDGQDNDCNSVADFGGASDEVDGDVDGAFDCDDCDDSDADTYPGAAELCDGIDNDCDGTDPASESEDLDGDTYSVCDGDCDDGDAASYDGAAEICDGFDNDCDGALPDDEVDADGDAYLECGDDCDDLNPLANPDIDEANYCDDGDDNDCDGDIDEDDTDCQGGDDDDATGDDDDSAGDDDDSAGDDDGGTTGCDCANSIAGGGVTASWLVLLLLVAVPVLRRLLLGSRGSRALIRESGSGRLRSRGAGTPPPESGRSSSEIRSSARARARRSFGRRSRVHTDGTWWGCWCPARSGSRRSRPRRRRRTPEARAGPRSPRCR